MASLLRPRVAQPSAVHLPLCVRGLTFFNMDPEIISSVMGISLFVNESLTNICIELLFSTAWGVLLTLCSHWHILSVTKEQADITEFPFQR